MPATCGEDCVLATIGLDLPATARVKGGIDVGEVLLSERNGGAISLGSHGRGGVLSLHEWGQWTVVPFFVVCIRTQWPAVAAADGVTKGRKFLQICIRN